MALTKISGYFPKEKNIIITKKELDEIIKKQVQKTGELFTPNKEKLIEAIIDEKKILKDFAEQHALHLYQSIFQGKIQFSPNDIAQYNEKLIKNALGYKGLLLGKKIPLLGNKMIETKNYVPKKNIIITQKMIVQYTKKQIKENGSLFNPENNKDILETFVKRTEKIHQKIEKDIEKILEKTRNKYIGLFPV
jgi:predicted oxidoreductase (fatty acid repression mutant protein)